MPSAVTPLASDVPLETDDDAFLAALEPVLAKYRGTTVLPSRRAEEARANARAVVDAIDDEEHRAYVRFYQCAMLSGGSLEVARALLAGERVPYSRLDPEWARRLGVFA